MHITDVSETRCDLTTVADLAAVPLDLSALPEWQPIRGITPAPVSDWPKRETRTPAGPMVPLLSNHTIRGPEFRPEYRKVHGLWIACLHPRATADPIWDGKLGLKFSRKPDPDAPMVTPIGSPKPLLPTAERQAEIAYYDETCCCAYHAQPTRDGEPHQPDHQGKVNDLATTYNELRANGMSGFSLEGIEDLDSPEANIAEDHLNLTPYCVRIEDEIVIDPDTGEPVSVPRYADMVYVSNILRRIEWEKFRDACGVRERVFFERRKRERDLGIVVLKKGATQEDVTALQRRMKNLWLDSHDALPDVDAHEILTEALKGLSAQDFMTDIELSAHKHSRLFGDEDPDPGRIGFHAEPDPKPLREQYAFGYCRWPRCDVENDQHNGCSIDGFDLFQRDLVVWEKANPDIGYAGPSGWIDIEDRRKSIFDPNNPNDDGFE